MARFRLIVIAVIAACSRGGDSRSSTRLANEFARSDAPGPITPSPTVTKEALLPRDQTPVDLAMLPTGPEVAMVLWDSTRRSRVVGWKAGDGSAALIAQLPDGFVARGIASHPLRRTLFVSGDRGDKSQILAFTDDGTKWRSTVILESTNHIGRLVVGPRPFDTNDGVLYRIFFSALLPDKSTSLRSITEKGKVEYQVVGPKAGVVQLPDAEEAPRGAIAPSADPLSIHPRGEPLLWRDERGCVHEFGYADKNWTKDRALPAIPCGGSASVTPNGAAYLYWHRGEAGVAVTGDSGRLGDRQATAYTFSLAPVSTPDGKGVMGVVSRGGGRAGVVYTPIAQPLADVANAWQLGGNDCDVDLFTRNGGLFRRRPSTDQLYTVFDTHNYGEVYVPPFLVTTDLLWENFAAAFNGAFILLERRHAMPAFWELVKAANDTLVKTAPASKWAQVFAALAAVRAGQLTGEAAHIARDTTRLLSSVVDSVFDFGELRPRGHYTTSEEMRQYFRAVHYLTEVGRGLDPAPLASLPADIQRKARAWIDVYRPFIALPRARLVWGDPAIAAYARHPWNHTAVFPLGWGFDNEVLESTVFHSQWPENEQIAGPAGPRMLPSGLDVAAAHGSAFAHSLLAPDIAAYPPLGPMLASLAARRPRASDSAAVFDKWLDAIAVEWADSTSFPGAPAGSTLWSAKRLQTGLASWASLREATILVTERAAGAEAGEGGFEELVTEMPRGYVEPSPKTFQAIAGAYDALARHVGLTHDVGVPSDGSKESEWTDKPLLQGILRRFVGSSAEARGFARMAEKELRGEALSDSEYTVIRGIGGSAEHQFLVYKSLADKDLALSTPDPLPKIADVAGGQPSGLLEVAVGGPLEWQQVVPYFGRREITLGSVYSYYELKSETPYDNERWRKEVDRQPHPAWIAPFVAPDAKACRPAARP